MSTGTLESTTAFTVSQKHPQPLTRGPRGTAVASGWAGEPKSGPRAKRGPDYRSADLRGQSFTDIDLQGADLENADLREADLRGADLFGARMRGADLRGTFFNMTEILEIWIPTNLPVEIVNQIRYFDFRFVTRRSLAPNVEGAHLPCPYRSATTQPILYEWGSKTWRAGAKWSPPANPWTLEEIVGSVLSALGCRHDLALPASTERY